VIAFNFEYHLLYASLMYLIVNEYYNQQNIHLGLLGIIGYLLAFFLPDIDIKSKASKKLPVISWAIQLFTLHRGFTHSLLFVMIVYAIFSVIGIYELKVGAMTGITSHLITDISTPMGVSLLWPLPVKIKLPIVRYFKRTVQLAWILILMYILTEIDKIILEVQKFNFK